MVSVGWSGEDAEFIMHNVSKGRGHEFDSTRHSHKLNIN